MKKRMYVMLTIMLTSTMTLIAANPEGYWVNHEYNVEIRVEETRDGIRVKRSDRTEWFTYEKVGKNKYEDYRRNQYKVSKDRMTWESGDGRQVLRFDRMGTGHHDHYQDQWGHANTCNHTGSCDCHQTHHNNYKKVNYRFNIEGKWHSRDRRAYIKVKKKNRNRLKVTTRHSSRVYYYKRIGDYKYRDNHGNILKFTNDGRAVLKTPHRNKKYVYYRR